MPSNQSRHKGHSNGQSQADKQQKHPPQRETITTERGQPREEQALMQSASSGTTMVRPHHRKVRSIHYTLSYELLGEEHGTDGAILLLHGLPGGAFSWRNIMPALAIPSTSILVDALRTRQESFHMLRFHWTIWLLSRSSGVSNCSVSLCTVFGISYVRSPRNCCPPTTVPAGLAAIVSGFQSYEVPEPSLSVK